MEEQSLLLDPLFDKYRLSLSSSTEACDEYHIFALLPVIGVLLGKSVWVSYGRRLYPCFYIVLVGPSGTSRKTTSLRFASELLEIASEGKIKTLGGLSSAEGLIRQLGGSFSDDDTEELQISEGIPVLVSIEEFSSLLRKTRQDSVSNLTTVLTEIYDVPLRYTLPRIKSPLEVTRPFLCMATSTTTEWLESSLDEEQISGGFCNRFLFVTGYPKDPIAFPSPPSGGFYEVAWKLGELHKFWTSKPAELTMAPGAEKTWQEFYEEWYTAEYSGELQRTLAQRIPEYALKISMVAAAINQSKVIKTEHVKIGTSMAQYAAKCVDDVFKKISLGGLEERCEKKILEKLTEANPVRRRDLQQKLHWFPAEVFNRALKALEMAEAVRVYTDQSGKRYVEKVK